jgi:translin
MDTLEKTITDITQELDNIDTKREKIISINRKLNRTSGRGIARIVKNEDPKDNLTEARKLMKIINEDIVEVVNLTSWKFTNSGVEEYVEFEILYSIINNNDIPKPDDIMVPSWMWISGLADVMGELRRIILNKLLVNKLDEAKELLEKMQIIYDLIVGLDFSKSIISNLRKKIDVARITIERTESDVVNASMSQKFR